MTALVLARNLGVLAVTLVSMEWLTTLVHRHVMHGVGWAWHRSHHRAERGWQRNDRFALVPAVLAILLFALAPGRTHWIYFLALGISFYGVLYWVVHDGLVHGRLGVRLRPRSAYLRHLIEAHHLHHAARERDGAVSFGFLYAPPIRDLRRAMRLHAGHETRP